MRLDDFNFDLPEELIAQQPVEKRDASRLLVVDRAGDLIAHRRFPDLVDYLAAGDCLILNDTRVMPARLQGRKETGGQVEVLLVRRIGDDESWLCLTRSSRPVRPGVDIVFAPDVRAEVVRDQGDGFRILRFHCPGSFRQVLDEIGGLPLPPYIRRQPEPADWERYQTVVARNEGAVAAPTAGLHFTPEVLERIRNRGCHVCTLTLHVGIGTFLPVRCDDIRQHRMHEEFYDIPPETAATVARVRENGGRVIAVGTTVTRALEDAARKSGRVEAGCGFSDLFIYPGFEFRVVDALVTNFHLPKSTLLMLVSAFAGRERILRAYREAVALRYRFFSYGDCMLIL
ncbi:S-adenosylmethionine--tRNA ribosyltransferase-isomerase [Geothermobacter ehrlichii]|uniref:S-adenosylmethionine:tRNA ribosyltransferase-isomerase n=1 Tax=Geothermobacter ehrlichii TaxID=213224 RepID=A0A5D3WKL7_9BACT|nr:tRNA preQ1(34) S-adenosylmethionine ribosyltransferase-isomerase QueA [Geothermobacter ehrlichii]TYO99557.1 S-adenosylmethionine--tRNA ribosyltransferase-isomerase [Geothermobacter ehrlichii]